MNILTWNFPIELLYVTYRDLIIYYLFQRQFYSVSSSLKSFSSYETVVDF